MNTPRLIDPDDLAVATILMEAESESYEGKLAVAQVIRNRMRLRYASDGTVASTVLWPLQFSCWNHNNTRRDDVCNYGLSDDRVLEAQRAWTESGHGGPLPFTAVLYHTAARPTRDGLWPPKWAENAKRETKIGAHVFYSDPT